MLTACHLPAISYYDTTYMTTTSLLVAIAYYDLQ